MKRCLLLLIAGIALLAGCAHAQSYPVRPVRIQVPYPPGSTVDFIVRLMAPRLQELWQQPVVAENKPGASAMIASAFVAKSEPDGHVLLMGGSQTHAMNVATIKNMLYDPIRDFTPVTQTTSANWILAVHPRLPSEPKELIDLIRSQPGKFTYGSSGIGGVSHLAFEMLSSDLGLTIVHSPYKGTIQAAADTMSGLIHMVMGDQATLLPLIKSGRLKAVALTGNTRVGSLPGLPTISETLVPEFDVQAWQGIWGPAGMNSDLVKRLNADVVRVLRMPEVSERLRASGIEPVGSSVDAFAKFVQREIRVWTSAAHKAGIKPE